MRKVEESTPLSTMSTASKTASTAAEKFYLPYGGRRWRIFKRSTSPNWYLVFQRAGKRYLLSLGATKETAISAAKVKIQAWTEDRLDVLRKSMERPGEKQYSTLTEFLTAAKAVPCGKEASRLEGCNKMRLVVKRAGRDPDTATTAVFGDSTAADYFRHIETQAAGINNQKDKSRFINSAISTFIGANALLAANKLRHYEGIRLPEMTSFREALRRSGLKVRRTVKCDPSWPLIRDLFREWIKLGKRSDYTPAADRCEFDRRNVWLAMSMELTFGLRINEVRQVRWEWFTDDAYGPVLRGDALVKNGSGELRMTPLNPFWRIFNLILDANGWRKTSGPLLEGDCISRTRDYPFKHIGAILRRAGWQTQKTNHALRDLSASLITTKFGAQKAQWWARHSSVTTTEAHYSRFVDQRAALTSENVLPWLHFAKR
jgi:integrase